MIETKAKVLVVYASGGGNTKEVAEFVSDALDTYPIPHDMYRVGSNATLPTLSDYGLILLGSYTIGEGRTPKTLVNFLKKVGIKHDNVAVFGTGDSQWSQYCGAADRLARFHESPYSVLKIEQSPRGGQEKTIKEWTTEVIKQWSRASRAN